MRSNPIQPFLDRYGGFVVDGGLATQLEAAGCDLNDDLWSARLLMDDPDQIRKVHRDYLWAGADCITAASYQATIPGFMKRGLSERDAINLIQYAVEIAIDERDAYWSSLLPEERLNRLRPLVAASVGPYAAYRADGSEYTGEYDLNEDQLLEFHRRRWQLLVDTKADLLACETIPTCSEARALARLLQLTPNCQAWFSFACQDGKHLNDGTRIRDCAFFLAPLERIAAVGVNCTAPRYIPSLIGELSSAVSQPIIVYPNSGELYDVETKSWREESVPAAFGTFGREWRKLGAAAIGGCCRTTPAHIRQIRDRFPWDRSTESYD